MGLGWEENRKQNVTKCYQKGNKGDHILRTFAKQESGDMGKDMRMGEKRARKWRGSIYFIQMKTMGTKCPMRA